MQRFSRPPMSLLVRRSGLLGTLSREPIWFNGILPSEVVGWNDRFAASFLLLKLTQCLGVSVINSCRSCSPSGPGGRFDDRWPQRLLRWACAEPLEEERQLSCTRASYGDISKSSRRCHPTWRHSHRGRSTSADRAWRQVDSQLFSGPLHWTWRMYPSRSFPGQVQLHCKSLPRQALGCTEAAYQAYLSTRPWDLRHCAAGCHRAPVAAAILLACLQGKSFDDAINHIQRLRNVEPWKIVGDKCDRDLISWVHTVANSRTLPDSVLKVPAEFISAASGESLWHMVPWGMLPDKPYPACKWRQADAHFKREVIFAHSANEAIVHDRPFCNACYNFMPAHVLGELNESRVKWRSRWRVGVHLPSSSRTKKGVSPTRREVQRLQVLHCSSPWVS